MRRALILWNTIALLVLVGILGVTVRVIVHAGMYAAVDRELAIRTEAFLNAPPRPAPSERRPRPRGQGNPFKIHRFDLSGRSLSPPGDYPLWDAAAFRRCLRGESPTTTIIRDGEPLRVLSRPVYEQGRLVAVVQSPYPVREVERAGVLLDRALLAMLPLVLLVAWGGAVVLTGRVLSPIRRLIGATEQIGVRNLSERLPLVGDDEFAVLTGTFNGMLDRLEAAFTRQKQFTEDASHELKTPLTRIKGTASMALAGPRTPERLTQALEKIDQASDGMSELVQDLLLLAQGDAGYLGENRKPIVPRALVEQARECVARPDAARIILSVEPGNWTLMGNEAELRRVLINLLDNALRHTPAEGNVTVTAQPGLLTVADTGCGIDEAHQAHLGERFYRADRARTRRSGGTGLGLAICKSIVAAHGGPLEISSAPGRGTVVRLHLPPEG